MCCSHRSLMHQTIFPVNDSSDDDEDLSGDFSPSSGTVSDIPGVSGSLQSYKVSFLFFSLEQQITDHLMTFSSIVTSECTALLGRRLGFRGVLDSGFSSCTVPTYYCGSEYFYNCCPQVQNLIGTEHSLNRSEHRVKSKAS